jgi:glyoxylase-like metal-dependent hydrolase (beta-lactamase superfamily II)
VKKINTNQLINSRRTVIKGIAGLMSLPALKGLTGCSPPTGDNSPIALDTQSLGQRVTVIRGAPGNLLALTTENSGLLLVDSGGATQAPAVLASLGDLRVHTLFNTHYHRDQTGGNVLLGEQGATIHAHVITRQWLSSDYYVAAEDRWEPALPAAGRPTETFRLRGEMNAGVESIEYGYLLEAHTRGDIYVWLRDSNILAVGDAVSPLLDPSLDWFAGGWLGGRVDALDLLLSLADEDTLIVPAYGPVISRSQLQAERDMLLHLYDRTTLLTTQGHSAQDMLEAGVMDEVDRKFQDPYRFLYDVAKGHWAHYTNFGGNIV